MFYDSYAAINTLGCLAFDIECYESDMGQSFRSEDFFEDCHAAIFYGISGLYSQGISKITSENIDNQIKTDPSLYEKYKIAGGFPVLRDIEGIFNRENFTELATTVKKHSLLRKLGKQGFPTRDFDSTHSATAKTRFEESSLEQIVEYYIQKVYTIQEQFGIGSNQNTELGEGLENLIESFKDKPDVGVPLQGDILNKLCRGARLGRFYLNTSNSGGGKALKNGTGVLTPTGYKSIESLQVMDEVFDESGNICHVMGVYPQGEKEIYRVTFSDKTQIDCCEDHLWNVASSVQRLENYYVTKSLKDILDNPLFLMDSKGYKRWNAYIPMCEPIAFSKKELPIAPYTLGALLGDGYLRKGTKSFSNTDQNIVDRVQKELLEVRACLSKHKDSSYDYDIIQTNKRKKSAESKEFAQKIRDLGLEGALSGTKFIPSPYLFSSVEDRLALLQGIIDTDGHCKGSSYDIVLKSKQLILDIQFLVESLGMTATYSEKKAVCYNSTSGKKDCGTVYRLHIKTSTSIPKIHWTPAKDQQWKPAQSYSRRSIRKIEKTGTYSPMTCIKVSSPSALFLTEHCIVTHNTRTAVGDACNIAFDTYYSNIHNKWIPNGEKNPVLFISTEMPKDEIQTIAASWLSGVNEAHLLEYDYKPGEKERIDQGRKIIQEQNSFFCEVITNPSAKKIQSVIKRHIRTHGVKYVFYDYIKISQGVMGERNSASLRTDEMLLLLATALKDIALEYNVFVFSGTQMSGAYRKTEEMKTEEFLAGAKAIYTMTDFATITMAVTAADMKKMGATFNELGLAIPTHVTDVYKSRRSKYSNVRVWRILDLGTGRVRDLLLTYADGTPITLEDAKKELAAQAPEDKLIEEIW